MQSFATTTENTTEFLGGCGTEEEPYLISTWDHLDNVRNYPDAYYELVCNLEGAPENEVFESIPFDGCFDGNGFWINANLILKQNFDDTNSLFATNKGTIQNVGIKGETWMSLLNNNEGTVLNCYSEINANFTGDSTNCGAIVNTNSAQGVIQECGFTGHITVGGSYIVLGAIVGANSGVIQTCYNLGDIDWSSQYSDCRNYVAGIAGRNNGVIKSSFNSGVISVQCYDSYVGGIAGENQCGGISKCYNTGTITASDFVGGITGGNGYNSNISKCYNTGTITGSDYDVGGIAGYNAYNSNISKCYNTGTITASDYVGGIAGGNGYDCYINECYNTGSINCSGRGGGIVGVGYSDSNITNCYTFTGVPHNQSYYSGFDFTNTWFLDSNTGYDYPQLVSNPQVQASEISLLSRPTNTEFIEDTIPDLSDGKVKVVYGNGYEVEKNLVCDMFPELDVTKPGTQTVPLQYGICKSDVTITFTVIEKELISISMATLPNKTTYVLGQEFDFSGATVALNYNNNTTEIIPISEIGGMSCEEMHVGNVGIELAHGGFRTSFYMTVRDKVVKKISVNSPTKLSYIEAQELDVAGGSVNVIYESEDDYTEQIELTLDMVSGYNKNQVGIQTLTVAYSGKTTTFVVNVRARTLTGMEWVSMPNKLTYLEGRDMLDVSGGQIYAAYNNGTSEVINLTTDMIQGFDNTAVGTQELTVCLGNRRLAYSVEIVPKSLVEIQISQNPNKDIYKIGEETVDVFGGKVLLAYNNDTTEEIVMTENMVSGLDATSAGIKDVVVTYGGKTTSFSVEVIDMIIQSEDIKCLKGSTIQVPIYLTNGSGFSYLKLKVFYDIMALELVSVENQELVSGMFTTSQSVSTNPYVMSWSSAADMEEDGCIVILTFKVLEDAPIGDYNIDITCAEASDQNLNDVTFIVEDAQVTICDYILGDVNRDNVVNGKDATLLMRYLAEWDVTIDLMAANVDSDNVVNGKDLVLLMQYLAEWDVTLG